MLVGLLLTVSTPLAWSIGIEPHKPGETPAWWKEWEGVPPVQVEPKVTPPLGAVPVETDEKVTRQSSVEVPTQLAIDAEGQEANSVPEIQGEQVLKQVEAEKRASYLRSPLLWFGGFFLLGGGIVAGFFRWLTGQAPSPKRGRPG